MELDEMIDLALGEWKYNEILDEYCRIVPLYQYNFIRREIKIRDKIKPYKIVLLRRLLKNSGNEDINIVVGDPLL